MRYPVSFLRKSLRLLLLSSLLVLVNTACQSSRLQPSARYGAAMGWDAKGNQMILFGGRAKGLFGERVLKDTWIFNLEDRTWRKFATDSNPPPRLAPGLVFDPDSNQLILFGGLGDNQRFGDTWILDLENGSWEEISPPVSPSPRSDMGMALDVDQRKALLFGGYCQEFEREKCSETWIFDLESRTWIEIDTEDSPPITYGLRLVFEPGSQRFLQWGGHMAGIKDNVFQSLGYADQLWSFSFTEGNWITSPYQAAATPRARYWHHLVSDPTTAEIILYGGDGGQGFLDDTWIYDSQSNQWRLVQTSNAPPPRIIGATAFDENLGQLILFGGVGEDFYVYQDTWIYSVTLSTWEQIFP